MNTYKYLSVSSPAPKVIEVRMNRPAKRNAMNEQFWREIGHCFAALANDTSCRCVLLTGEGKMFSAGIDLAGGNPFMGSGKASIDTARIGLDILRSGREWQQAWSQISSCGKPVIACVHGGCFGAALEMICAADIRFCTTNAYFLAPEVDLGMAADIGGLQRFPKIVGNDSLVRELMLSGRKMFAAEAKELGLVSHIAKDREALMKAAINLANKISSKSPVATLGIKTLLNYSRDHTVQDSLDYSLTWNAVMMQTRDVKDAGIAFFKKVKPEFHDIVPLNNDKYSKL